MSTTSEVPDFLTVEEAARVLRIGRTAAYALARVWRESGGREGLPVVPVGRLLRVPRAALEAMAGGAITASTVVIGEPQHASPPPASAPPLRQITPRQHSRATSPSDQPTLPLA
jgi:hypothetical protein